MLKALKDQNFRNIFFLVAAGGLAFTLFFDYKSYLALQASHLAGEEVVRSYDVLKHAQRLEHAVAQIRQGPKDDHEYQTALIELSYLEKMAMEQRESASELMAVQRALTDAGDMEQAARNIATYIDRETEVLQRRLSNDQNENASQLRAFFSALWIDCLLTFLMLGLIIADMIIRNRTEKNARRSLQLLREANQNLEEEALRRKIMNRSIVHDLKNPLGSIQGFASILSDEAGANRSVKEFSGTILKISESTLKLVESLLATKEKPAQLQPMELNATLEEVCQQAQGQARLKGQKLLTSFPSKPVTILGDPVKVDEVFFNLIGNAIKYSPRDSRISVSVFLHRDRARITVEDQGPGFTDADVQRAFHYGQTLSAKPTGGESSSGIGLFVVKQIVTALNGQIEIQKPIAGSGACVVVDFPLYKSAELPAPNV